MASVASLASRMAALNKASASAAAAAAAAAVNAPKGRGVPLRVATGIVIRAGTCDKTVKVRLGGETWNAKVKKVRQHHTQALLLGTTSGLSPLLVEQNDG